MISKESDPGKENTNLRDSIVKELNQTLAIVHTSSTYVLIEKSESDFVLDSKASLLTLYENQIVFEPLPSEDNKKKKSLTKAQIWLKSPNRRTYQNIVFNPKIAGHYDDNFNIWKGFAIQPKQGDCSLFWEHVEKIICSGNTQHFIYIRKWLAHLFQKPWMIGTALVLRGKQGTGKGVFVNAIGHLFGSHYAPLSSLDKVLGKFNAHLKNAILIYADEAIWGGNKKEIGALKALITEPKLFIEAKGKDGYWIDNYKHLIVSSNEQWAIHLDPDDRRFFVLDVSSTRKEDHAYFNAIVSQLEDGGYEALLYDLLHEDLEGFDPRIMPENYAGFDMKMASSPSIDCFIYASLKEGCFNHDNIEYKELLPDLIIKDFYQYYKNWCQIENLPTQSTESTGKRLRTIIPGITVIRAARDEYPKRDRMYVFPSLSKCRESFENFYKQGSNIWD